MRVRIVSQSLPWTQAEGAWFYKYEGEEFEVLSVHDGLNRLYEVDVRHLAAAGTVSLTRAFVPATFAEEVFEPPAAVVRDWQAARLD